MYDLDYMSAIIDEIALEGLDGITPSCLWLRLSKRPNFSLAVDEDSKAFMWRRIAEFPEVEFYELPEERGDLCIVDRYSHLDSKFGLPFETGYSKVDDIYPHFPVEKNGDKGSCGTYDSRRNVTDLIRDKFDHVLLGLREVNVRWGQRLSVVMSQRLRERALFGSNFNPQMELLPLLQFCLLERIARSRHQGELTSHLGEFCNRSDSKGQFHVRKMLLNQKLIAKQMEFHVDASGKCSNRILLHLTRFYSRKSSRMERVMIRACDNLSAKPMRRDLYSNVIRELGIEIRSFRRILTLYASHNCLRERNITYRELFPDSSCKESTFKNGNDKMVHVVEMIRHWKDVEDELEEDFEENENDIGNDIEAGHVWSGEDCNDYAKDEPIICTAYKAIEAEGTDGITIQSLSRKMGIFEMEARQILNHLQLRGSITGILKDRGTQHVRVFVSKYLVEDCKEHKMLQEEKQRILKLSAIIKKEPCLQLSNSISIKEESIVNAGVCKAELQENKKSEDNGKDLTLNLNCDLSKAIEAAYITHRNLKRSSSVMEEVKKHRMIEFNKMLRILRNSEKEEGRSTVLDITSLNRILHKLTQEGLIQSFKPMMKVGDQTKKLHYLCLPDMSSEDPLLTSTIASEKFRYSERTKAAQTRNAIVKQLASKSNNNPASLKNITKENDEQTSIRKFLPSFNHSYFNRAKLGRMRKLYQFMFYLVYDYTGSEAQVSLLNAAHPPVFNARCNGWKTFVPPLAPRASWPRGWVLLSDVILRMPFSILLELVTMHHYVEHLDELAADPVRRHYLVSQVPPKLRHAITYKRYHVYRLRRILEQLAHCGMVSFGPNIASEKDQVYIYLHRKMSIKNTCLSQDTDVPQIETYLLETMDDVADYWSNLQRICVSTSLKDNPNQELDSRRKEDMRERVRNKTVEEVLDDGSIPGDGLGAGGLDSSFLSHLIKQWVPNRTKPWEHKSRNKPTFIQAQPPFLRFRKKLKTDDGVTYVSKALLASRGKYAIRAKKRQSIGFDAEAASEKKIKLEPVEAKSQEVPEEDKRKSTEVSSQVDNGTLDICRLRIDWTPLQDYYLLLCKATSLFIQFLEPSLTVPSSIFSQVLKSEISADKSKPTCRRRLNILMRSPSTRIKVFALLEEAKMDADLRGFRIQKQLPIKEQRDWIDVFVPLFKKIHQKSQIGNEPEACAAKIKLPDSIEELYRRFDVIAPSSRPPMLQKEPKSIQDIRKSMIHALMFSFMNNSNDKANWSLSYYFLFERFKTNFPDIFADVARNLFSNRITSKERGFSQCRLQSFPYRLTNTFEQGLKSKFYREIYDNSFRYLKELELQTGDGKWLRITHHLESSQTVTLASLMGKDSLSISIKLPNDGKKERRETGNIATVRSGNQPQAFKINSKIKDYGIVRACDIRIQSKTPFIDHLQTTQNVHKQIIKKQKELLPSIIGESSSNEILNEIFHPEEFKAAESLQAFIASRKELGVTNEELYDRFPGGKYAEMLPFLKHLMENHLVVRVGDENFRYVDQQFAYPWITRSFVIPKEQKRKVSKIYQDLNEHNGECEDIERSIYSEHKWKEVKFVLRAWRKPDGSLNRPALKTILESVLDFLLETVCASQQDICQKYSASYQNVQILEVLEILEDLKCVTSISAVQSHKVSLMSGDITHALHREFRPSSQVFYEAEFDATVKLGHFLDTLIITH